MLLEYAEEGPADALGIIPGNVTRFPDSPGLSIPHMGWNRVETTTEHPVLESGYFYFVHSFYARPANPLHCAGEADYGGPFAAAIARDNIFATQFHPEKSAEHGLALYRNFLHWKP